MGERVYKGRISNFTINKGYRQTGLSKGGEGRTFKISQLIAITFLNHTPNGNTLVVDHRNGIKTDDRIENLRIVTNRDNTTTCFRFDADYFSSSFVGVSWHLETSKWESQIYFNKRKFF